MTARIPEDELLEDLRRSAEEADGTLTTIEYKATGEHSPQAVRSRFGTWQDGLEEAGLDSYEPKYGAPAPESGSWYRISEDELLEDLRKSAEEADRSLTWTKYDAVGEYSSQTVRNRFGSWQDGLEEAGLETEETIGPQEGDPLHKQLDKADSLDDLVLGGV